MISKYIEATILAFVQGFSEFIPVSSSAHLILVSKISSFNLGSLQLDICLHLGSLIAILFYFRKDIKVLIFINTTQGGQNLKFKVLICFKEN